MSPGPAPSALEDARGAARRNAWAEVLEAIGAFAGTEGSDLELNALAVNAAVALKRWPVALAGLARLAELQPGEARWARMRSTCHNNRGAALLRDGQRVEAAADFDRALALWPGNREAAFNAARLALDSDGWGRARVLLEALLQAEPEDAEALRLLARAHAGAGDAAAARTLVPALTEATRRGRADAIEAALLLLDAGVDAGAAVAPALACDDAARVDALVGLGLALMDEAAPQPARQVYGHARLLGSRARRPPPLRSTIAERLSLPLVYPSQEALAMERTRYGAGLQALLADAEAGFDGIEPSLEQVVWTNFLLAYQGRDDRELQQGYGAFLARALADLAPDLRDPPRSRGRRRIGFVGSAFRDSTVGTYFGPWVAALANAGFEVTVFQLGPGFDAATDRIAAPPARLQRLEHDLRRNAQTIRALALDLLIYPDPAADARVFPLAALRLAPRQIAAWGHPVTTGLASIDTYVSCAEMEPADAASHYSERLALLPALGTDYARPARPPAATRAELGLPGGRLYLVPQSAWKLHPDTDAVLAQIAARDAAGTIACFEAPRPGATRALRQRLAAALRAHGAEPERQLLLLPLCPRARFLQLCASADVMLDTPHWSGGNSALDALATGLPIIAFPGSTMRSRQSLAMLRRIGLEAELVATTPAAQVELALAVAQDPERREAVHQRIVAGHAAIYGAQGALPALREMLEGLLLEPPRA